MITHGKPRLLMPVQIPDEHWSHPGPVLVRILKCLNKIFRLHIARDTQPCKTAEIWISVAAIYAIFGGITQPAEFSQPDLLVNTILFQNRPYALSAAENKFMLFRVCVGTKIITIWVVSKGIEPLLSTIFKHLFGEIEVADGFMVGCCYSVSQPR